MNNENISASEEPVENEVTEVAEITEKAEAPKSQTA